MEKKWLLDACLKALGLTLLAVLACACTIPRVALMRDPLSPEEHIDLGVSYEKRGELDAALKEYKTAARKKPLAYLYMGNIYFQQGSLGEAIKSYKKAITKTGSPEAYNNLAWLYYVSGTKRDEAEQLAARAVELSPASDAFRDTLEKIREKKDWSKAHIPLQGARA